MKSLVLVVFALMLCSFGDGSKKDEVTLTWDEVVMIYEVGRTGCELDTDQIKDLEELKGILLTKE